MTNGKGFSKIFNIRCVKWREQMQLFSKSKNTKSLTELPALLKPENPVNYNSVLDYLVGLSKEDYEKMIKVTRIYREANTKAAGVLDVEDQPTTALKSEAQTDEEIDSDLDTLLDEPDLETAFLDDDAPGAPEPQKAQAPSKETKITVQD